MQLPQLSRKRDTAVVGLEIEAGSVAAAEIQTEGPARLTKTAVAQLPPGAFHDGEVVDAAALTTSLRALFVENKLSRRVRLGIANQRVVVRSMRLPAIDDPKQLEMAVRSLANEEIPMPLEQAVLDHRVVGGIAATDEAPAQIVVVVVAARRDMIEATLKPIEDAGLEPVGVDLSAFGLIRALAAPAPTPGAEGAGSDAPATATLYCNVGDVTNLAIAKKSSCLFTRVSPTGLEAVASGLAAGSGLTEKHARMWLDHVGLVAPLESIEGDSVIVERTREALERGVSSVIDEVRLSLDFYAAQDASVPVGEIVLGGSGSAIPGFVEAMSPEIPLPISIGVPQALAEADPSLAARMTLPYGLALEA